MRLHRGGRFRGWLGARLGGDAELGDRVWRRALHALGALVLLYYVVPPVPLGLLPKLDLLLLALAIVLVLELSRHAIGLEFPTIRAFEAGRPASFAYFAVALVAAVLLFPEPIAAAVVLGAALVDPLVGELRRRPAKGPAAVAVPLVVYLALAATALRAVGDWSVAAALAGAAITAALAIGVERIRLRHLDDDLTMPLVPGAALTLLVLAWPALPHLGA